MYVMNFDVMPGLYVILLYQFLPALGLSGGKIVLLSHILSYN